MKRRFVCETCGSTQEYVWRDGKLSRVDAKSSDPKINGMECNRCAAVTAEHPEVVSWVLDVVALAEKRLKNTRRSAR